MNFPKQAELDRFLDKLKGQQALSLEELQSFSQLNQELSTWKTDCEQILQDIVSKIVTHGITLDQLVSRDELRHWRTVAAVPTEPKAFAGIPSERRKRTPNPELVIFKIQPPGAKGAPTAIHRGELPAKMGAKLQWLLQREGDLESNLMTCVDSDEARAYLANEEGKIFLEKLLNWIKSQQP
jgi:hypothetical protein